jgi:uncharacterized membrane protein YfhO
MPFIQYGKSFVWDMDGVRQHYPMLRYYGTLLRNLLLGKGFPMLDFHIGMGFDTITTLHYYVLGDPITLLSVFITKDNALLIYDFIVLLRFYLVGISFIIFCKYFKKNGNSVLFGALIYAFCGFTLYAGVRHPFFLNPMIYLPILIIGLEEVLKRKKPYLLVIITFISIISNFYFFYILTMISVLYVLVRYFTIYRKNERSVFVGLFKIGLRTGGYYLLGCAMGAFLFIPVVYAFLGNGRLDDGPEIVTGYFRYSLGYYLKLLQGVFSTGEVTGYWTELSFCSVTAVSFVIMLWDKKYRRYAIAFISVFCALLFPFIGYFMNGFAYATNRWSFVFSLLAAYCFTLTYEQIFYLKKMEKIILAIGTTGYGIIAFLFPSARSVKLGFLILLITVISIYILQISWFRNRQLLREVCFTLLIFITIGFHGFAYYSPKINGYVNEFLTKSKVEKLTTKGALTLISDIDDNTFYRVETYGDTLQNEALCVGFHDVSGYYSLMDGSITSYFKNLELLNQRSAYRFDNLDNRTVLNALASVKYLVSTKKEAAAYGFRLIKEDISGGKSIYLFKNNNALPIGYTYENYILEDDYNKLSALEKQNAMLYAAVLREKPKGVRKAESNVGIGIKKLKTNIFPDENIEIKDNLIKVKKSGGTITLLFNSEPGTETYVSFRKLNLTSQFRSMVTFKIKGETGAVKYINVRSKYYGSYFGKENYLVNLGYSDSGETSAVITFLDKKNLKFEDIKVYCQDMSYVQAQINRLLNSSIENVRIGNNNIEGDISLQKNGVMMFSIPYSKGFHALVDNKNVELLRGNGMYIALPLEAGDHHIVIKYETPYLKVGCIISVTALLLFVGIILREGNWRKKYKK